MTDVSTTTPSLLRRLNTPRSCGVFFIGATSWYNKGMYESFRDFLSDKQKICVIQAENPDGDSLGSALGLDEILSKAGKEVSHYCPVNIPKYLHYFADWSRVDINFDFEADGYLIVDTASDTLLSKLMGDAAIKNKLFSAPVFVLDHHEAADDLKFPHEIICETLPACCELIYRIAKELKLEVTPQAAEHLMAGIASDTLGMTSQSMTPATFAVMAELAERGADISEIEARRREFMKKSQRILSYKGELIGRIEYYLEGRLAVVHIPWDDIREYSDEYNPGVLIIEEMKMVEGVEVAVAIKTYPDGKVTGKVRTSQPIADSLAGFWGGGGHLFASGFRTYDSSYDEVLSDLIHETDRLLPEPEPAAPAHDSGNRMRIGKL